MFTSPLQDYLARKTEKLREINLRSAKICKEDSLGWFHSDELLARKEMKNCPGAEKPGNVYLSGSVVSPA